MQLTVVLETVRIEWQPSWAWSSWWMHREPGLLLPCFQCLIYLVLFTMTSSLYSVKVERQVLKGPGITWVHGETVEHHSDTELWWVWFCQLNDWTTMRMLRTEPKSSMRVASALLPRSHFSSSLKSVLKDTLPVALSFFLYWSELFPQSGHLNQFVFIYPCSGFEENDLTIDQTGGLWPSFRF